MMLSKDRIECLKSELGLWTKEPVQDSIKETRFESHSTITAKDDDSPLEFVISGVGEDYMDSHNMWLYTSLEVRNADGSALAADEKVAPINNFFQCLIEQIQVTANGTIVAHTSEAYIYTAYLLNVLFTSREVKDSFLCRLKCGMMTHPEKCTKWITRQKPW